MKELELLAPAGSLKTLKAVIHAGADAVYLGGSMFGARAYANNFNEEELLSYPFRTYSWTQNYSCGEYPVKRI